MLIKLLNEGVCLFSKAIVFNGEAGDDAFGNCNAVVSVLCHPVNQGQRGYL